MSKYVRVMRSIWTDPDWLELSSRSKMIYLQLISQANISKAGVLPTVPRRWASMYPDLEVDDILAAIDDLDAKIHQVRKHIDADDTDGPFTAYHRRLERVLYKPA